MAPAAMGRKRAPPGAGRDVLQPESHVAHGNGARRSGCEDKLLGFDAESPRVRKSKDGCAHSRRLQNCRTVETARAPVIERGADARGSGSREKRGGADSRHGVDGPRTRDAGHTGPHGARLHRCGAHRQEASRRTSGAGEGRGGDCLLTGTGFFLLFSFWFWMVKLLELDGSDGCITVTILKATELDFGKGEFYGM